MNRKEVALGQAAIVESGVGTTAKPASLEERVAILETKIDMILKMLAANGISERVEEMDLDDNKPADKNKDGIPIDLHLIGSTKGQVFLLSVRPEAYYIGNTPYRSLSAAATAVRGTRVSGWVFWRLPDGRTAKEVFARS